MSPAEKRRITAEDLYQFQIYTGGEISPDGKQVIFALQRVDQKTEKKYQNLWVVPADGGEPRQFTYGDQVDTQPRWSPDSQWIAFISNRGDEKQPQIYKIPVAGGEARPVTDLKGELASFHWSPDGQQFVCQFRKTDADVLEREKDEQKKKLGVVDRPITRVFYKLDGTGYLPKERWHIWTIDAQSGEARQLTNHPVFDEIDPAWSPDGKQIVYCSNRAPDPDLQIDQTELFIWDTSSSTERRVGNPSGVYEAPSFSPDGKWIAYIGREGFGNDWRNYQVWVVPSDGQGSASALTTPYDIHVSSFTINDMGSPSTIPPVWSKDGKQLFFQVAHNGSTTLMSVDREGNNLKPVIDTPGVVTSFSMDSAGEKVAYFLGQMADPGQIWMRDLVSGESRALTSLNRELLDSLDLGEMEEVWFKGAAGNDLQGWILKPPGFDPSRKYPSILEIHGGPLTQYGNFFMHEFYFLAASDYVVAFCNPRGGQGYGEEHSKAIHNNYGRWGSADYADLMAWADIIAQKPYIDPDRMGVTGGSYGGYMTNWIIGHTDRFKAAVTQRSVSNLVSMWGSSDFNWAFQEMFDNRSPYDSIEVMWECSPLKHLGNAKTPTLVLHNQQDLRCPIEQGEQVFVALKKVGVDTEMVIFPDEPHGLSRVGRTDRRIARLKHIRRWFDRHLKNEASNPGEGLNG